MTLSDMESVLDEAALGGATVHFDYTDAKGESSRRAVVPEAVLANGAGDPYLFAVDLERMHPRNFRLDRMTNLDWR